MRLEIVDMFPRLLARRLDDCHAAVDDRLAIFGIGRWMDGRQDGEVHAERLVGHRPATIGLATKVSPSARFLRQAPDRPTDALVRAMARHRTADAHSGSSRTQLIHPTPFRRRESSLSSSEGAQPPLRPLHLVGRETEFCGQRLAGDFRRRMRENGRNSVRRPRHRLTNRPELRGFLPTRKPRRFAGTAWWGMQGSN